MKPLKTSTLIFSAICAVLAFGVANKISFQVRSDLADDRSVVEVTKRFWLDITEQPLHLSFDQMDLIVGMVGILVVGLAVLYHWTTQKTYRHGEEHGSARWGTPRDIKPFMNPDRVQNLLFTRTERLSLDSRKTQRNQHVLVVGSSGSGKTRYYVLPNIAQMNQSFVITDPKGELLEGMGQQLIDDGYQVRVFNLLDFALSDTWNPFAYLRQGHGEDVALMVHNLITNTNGSKPSGDQSFWEKTERALLSALCAYVYGRYGEEATFNHVTALLGSMKTSESDEAFESAGDREFLAMREYLDELAAAGTTLDAEAQATVEMLEFAWSQYNIYTTGAGETKKSVLISLGVRLGPLYMPQLQRLLGSNSIDATSVGTKKSAVFLVIPDSHSAFGFLVCMFYDLFFQKNMAIADASPGRRLPVPVHCFMDEFANVGKLPDFEKKIAVIRSRGIAVSVVLQNFAQGKALYKDDWETIVGNCDSKLFLGGDEESTTQWVSKRLGKQTIDTRELSEQKGRQGSHSHAHRKLGRELMTPDEVATMPTDEALYFLRGLAPFRSKKLDPVATGNFEYVPEQPQLVQPNAVEAEPEVIVTAEPLDASDIEELEAALAQLLELQGETA